MSAMFLKGVDATGSPERFEIPDGRAQTDVGRSSDCAIVLPSKSVSRVHARFHRRGVELLIEDLGSSNGTTVNGTRIQQAVPVRPGDRIRFGSLEFVLEEPAAAEDEAETLLASSLPLEPPATATAPPSTAPADAVPSAPPTVAASAKPPEAPAAPPTIAATAPPTRPAPAMVPPPQSEPTRTAAPKRAAEPAKEASPLELALIATGAYLGVVAAGFAVRWLLG